MKYLITGGCGFLGSNIAESLLKKGDTLHLLDNLSRIGSEKNLDWLRTKGNFEFHKEDIRDAPTINALIKELQPDVIYHLAGQVAMTTSISNPRMDFEINVMGTINVLEAVRNYSPQSIITYSSTNKVYGDLEWVNYDETSTRYVARNFPLGFSEDTQLDFHSPYGVSKGSADQYCLDFARIYGLNTVVFRHSSMFGGRQFSTYDQGWIGWFCSQAILQQNDKQSDPFTISGNGKQVRDVLYSLDMVDLYLAVPQYIQTMKGNAFNIGGGMKNSLSLLELFTILENLLHVDLKYHKTDARISDQKVFVADLTKVTHHTGWAPKIEAPHAIELMLNWLMSSKLDDHEKN